MPIKLTPDHIEHMVVSEQYHHFPGTTMTVCCLTLQNGFTVSGDSACVNPEDFNKETGQIEARKRAISKVWSHAAYVARTQLTLEEAAGAE